MPLDGLREPVEHRGLGFLLHARQSKVPILGVVVEREVTRERCND